MAKIGERFARLPEPARKRIEIAYAVACGIIGGLTPWGAFSVVLAVLAVAYALGAVVDAQRHANTRVSEFKDRDRHAGRVPGPRAKSRARRGTRDGSVMSAERGEVRLGASSASSAATGVYRRAALYRRLSHAVVMRLVCVGFLVIGGVLAHGVSRWVILVAAGTSAFVLVIAMRCRADTP